MKKFAFNKLRPETLAKYQSKHLAYQKESAPRKIKFLMDEIESAKKDGESSSYITFLQEKVEKQKKYLAPL
jgi:hypothetical protein